MVTDMDKYLFDLRGYLVLREAGELFIDENFASIRGPGEAIGLHSGGQDPVKRTQFLYRHGAFMCGQINILLALTDIGPGDGASVDGVEGAVEVHLNAGDAIFFVDALAHEPQVVSR